MEDFEGKQRFAEYKNFKVDNEKVQLEDLLYYIFVSVYKDLLIRIRLPASLTANLLF